METPTAGINAFLADGGETGVFDVRSRLVRVALGFSRIGFDMSLPSVEGAHSESERSGLKSGLSPTAKSVQVLVVDDNRDAADVLSLLLHTLGYVASVSYHPFDALALAKRMSPALLFVDIGLPDMHGYELVRRLRASPETAHSLIVAYIGYEQLQDKERALQAGCDHHLVKPANFGQFVELLAMHV